MLVKEASMEWLSRWICVSGLWIGVQEGPRYGGDRRL